MNILRPALAAFIVFLVLIQPNHPAAFGWGVFLNVPLELPAILLAAMTLGQSRAGFFFRIAVTAILVILVTLKGADMISFNALSRGFNPVSDVPLIEALVRLLTGAIGPVLAIAAIIGTLAFIVLTAALVWWALRAWARIDMRPMSAIIAGAASAVFAVVAVAEVGHTMGRWTLPVSPPGTAFTARLGVERIVLVQETLADLRIFRTAATQDPFTDAPDLFTAIDRDVIVIFVESYGRTSFDTPFYADLHRHTLSDYEGRLGDLGVSMQSGFLTSPTQGGQSWLAHSTFANGLWIDNQTSYAAALASGRETLFHYGASAGLHTAVVMPQITLDWPEVEVMGFDTVLVSEDLGYEGLPFNWVTMPDQFSLAAMDRLLRQDTGDTPTLMQIALVSSHAPWLPVPQIIPWEDLGDGTIFNEVASSGDTPAVVWRDYDRVRDQYRLAIDYALQSVLEYAVLHADSPPLMIVVGDHQAAEFIALDDRAEVPIHIIGPAQLVERLSQAAPYAGLLPPDDAPVTPMDQMRDIILRAFADPMAEGEEN